MFVTTRAYYAVRALVYLAENADTGTITLKAIADGEGISRGFLEQLMIRLKKAGIVESSIGPGGGYRIDRPFSDIDMLSVLEAAGEEITMSPCACAIDAGQIKNNLAEHACERLGTCPSARLWGEAANLLKSYFKGTSLADLLSAD